MKDTLQVDDHFIFGNSVHTIKKDYFKAKVERIVRSEAIIVNVYEIMDAPNVWRKYDYENYHLNYNSWRHIEVIERIPVYTKLSILLNKIYEEEKKK